MAIHSKHAFSFFWLSLLTACVAVDGTEAGDGADGEGAFASSGGNAVVTGSDGGNAVVDPSVGGSSTMFSSGGMSTSVGGDSASGGDASSGGDSSEAGGAASGGASSGGSSSGGSASGGAASGGAASGGSGGDDCDFPNWQEGADYYVGDIVWFDGALYVAENDNPGYDPTISTWFWDPYSGDCDGGSSSGGSGSGGSQGTGGSSSGDPCSAAGLTWKSARKTHYTSYPDPGSEECIKYNGCTWAGWFAGCEDQQSEEWVEANNIAAMFPNFGTYELHDVCIKSGDKTMVVTIYDTCADSDCDGCCTANKGANDALIDLESYTNDRWGLPDGIIQWADLGPTKTGGCE